MVGFVGRFRKPKLPAPPRGDDNILPQRFAPPVLRNFSYPSNVGNSEPPPQFPFAPEPVQTAWDQLGEICSFSPDCISRTGQEKTPKIDNPFFFKSDTDPYGRLDDESESFGVGISSEQLIDRERPSEEELYSRKKQRRTPKLPRSQSFGDRIFAHNSIFSSRLKRNSLGQHKTVASLDASRFITSQSGDIDRPVSSSGVPLVDTRLKLADTEISAGLLQPLLPSKGIVESQNDPKEASMMQATAAMGSLNIHSHRKNSSYGGVGSGGSVPDIGGSRKQTDSTPESTKHKGKDGKHRWYSQLKGWVSVSEPSAQALKQYKKETYRKADIALDDPRANAKLHLPVGMLPREAIKPSGRGPDPEEIAMKRAEQQAEQQKMRHFDSVSGETSRGSRSSVSRYSSSSSVTFSAPKEDASW
ncbi:hypothetical protein F5Y04DRAFT_278473 [Hypomontagnella monticulosa]|nr:hypothetical protein F5Y04DRAFT_278473 [Hypomontagnella monticulosa]